MLDLLAFATGAVITLAAARWYLNRMPPRPRSAALNRPLPPYAATRPRRRALVALWSAGLCGIVFGRLQDSTAATFVQITVLASLFGLMAAGRICNRSLDPLLDERERALRDRVHVRAYRILAAVTAVACVALRIDGIRLDRSIADTATMALIFLAVGLPSAIAVWLEPLDRDDDTGSDGHGRPNSGRHGSPNFWRTRP